MVASAPILTTKLYIPPPPLNVVLRTRLIEQLNQGLAAGGKITLISAPAGFGKTTLVSEWIHGKDEGGRQKDEGGGRKDKSIKVAFHPSSFTPHPSLFILHPSRVAWLSLDEGDSDPTRFLTYIVAALRTAAPKLGEGLSEVLQASQPPPAESILSALLNEIMVLPGHFILVLDDYHVIDSRAVDEALTFLVEHLPPQLHLVITTREDPALPLPRLRARRQLTELRAADLRFTPSEAAEFLDQVMDLPLSVEEVAALEARTEGWIAGLQLAALSMRGHQDIAGFIQTFAGDHRYIVDYLAEEVLQRQPESIRNFLLRTSILDRLNGPLCDAVMGNQQEDSSTRLEALQRGNFFLIPLDDRRHWYRYHHLFADVLQVHLLAEQPDQVPALHRRASVWFEQNGSPVDAIRHALAGGDFERAAGLIELATPAMHRSRQEATVLGWMKALPEELFRNRPVLSMQYVGTVMSNGGIEGVEARLRDAERWLEMIADRRERPKEMVVVNEEEFRRLPRAIAMYRAGLALAQGDVPETVTYARRALDLAPEEDHLGRGAAAGLMGLAFWTDGDLEAGYRWFADGMAHLQRAGNISDAVGGVLALADIRITQGRLGAARHTYERALQLAKENGTPTLRGTADMYVGMSELEREHNDLQSAMQLLLRSQEQGEHTGFPQHPYRWRVAMARIHEAHGDLDGALALLEETEPLYVSDFFPNVRPITALKTRVRLAQGRLEEALGWARRQGLSPEDNLSYLREFEHITLARVLLALYRSDRKDSTIREATGLLERLLQAAQEGGRTGNVIEILTLQALAHQALGDVPGALPPLERALTLAEPEGYVRMFLDEGEPMAGLLREAASRGIMPGYTGKLLGAFEAEGPISTASEGQSPLPTSRALQPLVEPLTGRELEILRLFNTELSGPEIARELVIGLSTVRTHTKSIYSKLNVNTRRAAVRRAEELGLI
jgi:LuxR family transcriptional regulator, maltose regulon positive regulatory protein